MLSSCFSFSLLLIVIGRTKLFPQKINRCEAWLFIFCKIHGRMNDWTNPTRYKWLLTPLGCKTLGSGTCLLSFSLFCCSCLISPVFAGCHSRVRESQSRNSIWEALFLSLNLILGMQTLLCITSFNRNNKRWSPLALLDHLVLISAPNIFLCFSDPLFLKKNFCKLVFSIILSWSSLAVSVCLHLVFINAMTV